MTASSKAQRHRSTNEFSSQAITPRRSLPEAQDHARVTAPNAEGAARRLAAIWPFFALWHVIQSQFSHGIRGTGPPCSQQALPAVLEIPQPRSCCSQPVFLLLVFTVPFISKYILLSLQVTAPLQLFSLKILPAVGKPQKCSSRYMHQLVSATRMLSTRFLLSALYQPSP